MIGTKSTNWSPDLWTFFRTDRGTIRPPNSFSRRRPRTDAQITGSRLACPRCHDLHGKSLGPEPRGLGRFVPPQPLSGDTGRAGRGEPGRRHHGLVHRKGEGLDQYGLFPRGNLAPEGSVVKSTSIDPSVVDKMEFTE